MTLSEFQNWALGQGQVGKYDDGGYVGQCVSLVNQYCYRVLGVPAQSWGNAAWWGSNSNTAVLTYFDHVASPQAGDIGVMGTNYGSGVGHIFIYLSPTTILEQNGKASLRITTNTPYPNPIAILRKKGNSMGDFSQEANDRQNALIQISKEVSVNYQNLNDVAQIVANIRQLYALVNEKDKQIAEAKTPAGATQLKPGLYKVT